MGIPGHALGYKIGRMKMLELREKAEKALGTGFAIKEFHEILLGQGTMLLFILEEHVDHFMAKEKN